VKHLSNKAIAVTLGALLVAAVLISPAIGGPSLKKLVKKEVRKQLANKRGPAGPAGPAGATGPAGPRGTSFNANSTLPSGQTLTGVWLAAAANPGTSATGAHTMISFVPQLPANLGVSLVHRIQGTSTTTQCPGPGRAAAGHLCVYERDSSLSPATFSGIFDPVSGTPGANRRAAQLSYNSAMSGLAVGSWAVTAP
jgi:hypothetical protein